MNIKKLNGQVIGDLPTLLGIGNVIHIPLNAGWTEVVTVDGSTVSKPFNQYVVSGAGENGTALLYTGVEGFDYDGGGNSTQVDWDNKLYFIFNYRRYNSDANAIARVQIKEVNTIGALAALGIGLRADNLALVGESYGTEIGEVALNVTIGVVETCQVVIVLDPSVPDIKWYIDGVLKGTQSTAAKIPSGTAGGASRLMHSILKTTGATNSYSMLLQPILWQER